LHPRIRPTFSRNCIIWAMGPGKVIFEGKTSKGAQITIRYPKADDLADLLAYINTLSAERTFISFQGEQLTEEKEKKFLDSILEKISKGEDVHLLAFSNNQLIGVANVSPRERNAKHTARFGISIAKEFRHVGIGRLLMEKVLAEAKKNLSGLKTITLDVFANNSTAIQMYKKFGFKQYGLLPEGVVHQNEFIDKILMYKNV